MIFRSLSKRKQNKGGGNSAYQDMISMIFKGTTLKGISAEFQVIRGFSQKIPADLLSYDKIHS